MRTVIRAVAGAVVSAVLLAGGMLAAQQDDPNRPLTNPDVIALVHMDLGDAVVVAKIHSAKQVRFDTSLEGLAALKKAGASQAVIAAMVGRAAVPAPEGEKGAAQITLVGTGGPQELAMTEGKIVEFWAPFVGHRRLMQFDESRAQARVRDKRPSLLAATSADPKKNWFVVKLDSDKDDNDRSMDAESPGLWGGVMSTKPDEDNQLDFDSAQEQPGVWKITLRKDLKPGEYGLYSSEHDRGFLYGFGVDK